MISVTCPGCGKRFKTPDHFAGKVAKCSACGGRISIPHQDAPDDDPLNMAGDEGAASADPRPPRAVGGAAAAAVAEAPPVPSAAATKTSNTAVASLVSSIIGVALCPLAVVGIVLGVLAIKRIDAHPQRNGGRGVAIAGISVGAAAIVLWLLIGLAFLLWWLMQSKAPLAAAPPPAPVAVVETPVAAPPPPPPPKPAPTEMYYYDLNTGQLFSGPIKAVPPIAAPSGKAPSGEEAGVKAYVFSCGDCADEKQRYIGWLEKADAVAKQMLENPNAGPNLDNIDQLIKTVEQGPLQVSEDGKSWVSFTSQEGVDLMQKAQSRCGGAQPVTCFP